MAHCSPALGVFHADISWCQDSLLSVKALTWPTLLSFHPAVGGVPCSQGQRLPGHRASAAWLQLPACGGIRVCIFMSPLSGPALQHRLSPALVSRILTWHVVRRCVLGSVCGHCWGLVLLQLSSLGRSAMTSPDGEFDGKNPAVVLGSLSLEIDEISVFKAVALTTSWSLLLIETVHGTVLSGTFSPRLPSDFSSTSTISDTHNPPSSIRFSTFSDFFQLYS